MTIAKLEQKLLEKLDAGLLDGVCGKDVKWSVDNAICRKMIVRGIPYYIAFADNAEYCSKVMSIEQYFETDEMRLWFIKMHGWEMDDPDAKEYSHPTEIMYTKHWIDDEDD